MTSVTSGTANSLFAVACDYFSNFSKPESNSLFLMLHGNATADVTFNNIRQVLEDKGSISSDFLLKYLLDVRFAFPIYYRVHSFTPSSCQFVYKILQVNWENRIVSNNGQCTLQFEQIENHSLIKKITSIANQTFLNDQFKNNFPAVTLWRFAISYFKSILYCNYENFKKLLHPGIILEVNETKFVDVINVCYIFKLNHFNVCSDIDLKDFSFKYDPLKWLSASISYEYQVTRKIDGSQQRLNVIGTTIIRLDFNDKVPAIIYLKVFGKATPVAN